MSMNILNDISAVYLEQVSAASRARNAVADDRLDAEQKKTNASMNRLRQQSNSNRVARVDAAAAARKVESDVKNSSAYGPQRPKPGTVTGRRIEETVIDEAKKRKIKRWWDDDGNGIGYEEGEVSGKFKRKKVKESSDYDPMDDDDFDHDEAEENRGVSGKNNPKGGKALGKKKKSKGMKEGFSNWRQDLSEVMDDIEASKEIKEKKNINNKVKTSAMGGGIKLGEAVEQLGGELIEMVEVELTEEVNIATEYFYEQGLNEYGIDLLIEDLGIEEFVDFVNEIVEEYTLVEARTLTGKKKIPATGTSRGVSLKAAPGKTTKSAVEKYGTTRRLSSSDSPTIKKNRVAVKKAVVKQPETKSTPTQTKTGIAGRIGAALGAAVKRGKEDVKRVQDAAQTARNVATRRGAEAKAVYDAVRERGKKAEQSATVTRARRKATVAAGRAAQAAAPVVKKAVKAGAAAAGAGAGSLKAGNSPAAAVGRAAGTFVRKMTKEELELQEKSESEQQQKLFGLALSVKRGDTPRSEVSDAVLKIVDSMSEKKIRDFAKTKHKGLPQVKEDVLNEREHDEPGEGPRQEYGDMRKIDRSGPATSFGGKWQSKGRKAAGVTALEKLTKDKKVQEQMDEPMEPAVDKQAEMQKKKIQMQKVRELTTRLQSARKGVY